MPVVSVETRHKFDRAIFKRYILNSIGGIVSFKSYNLKSSD